MLKQFAQPGVYRVGVTVTTAYGQSFYSQTSATISGVAPVPVHPVYPSYPVYPSLVPFNAPAPNVLVTAPAGCVPGQVNGVWIYSCGLGNFRLGEMAVADPACYLTWLQTGAMPACALAFRG